MNIYMTNEELEALLKDYENSTDVTKDAICTAYLSMLPTIDGQNVLEVYTYLSIFIEFKNRFSEFHDRCRKFDKLLKPFVTMMVPFILLDGTEHRRVMDLIRAGMFTSEEREAVVKKLKEYHANKLPGLRRDSFFNCY